MFLYFCTTGSLPVHFTGKLPVVLLKNYLDEDK